MRHKPKRLNDTMVEKLSSPKKDDRDEYPDMILTCLELRITKNGKKTWSLLYRIAGAGAGGIRGKKQRMTLGAFPLMKTGPARDAAKDKLEIADRGEDPAKVKAAEIEGRNLREFETVVTRFIDQEIKPNVTSWRNIDRVLKSYVVPE
jgi:hypothetical protein